MTDNGLIFALMSDGRYLVTHKSILTHGIGDTPAQARADFVSMAQDMLHSLLMSDNLAPCLNQQIDYINEFLDGETDDS